GSTVTVKGPDGTVLGTGTVDNDGNFTVTLEPPQTNGETLDVNLKDAAGNESTAAQVNADDTTGPVAATDLDVSDDGSSLSGKGEPGSTVTVK
ncbi:Ig-like domain-containing protein, partial [Erwinia sp. S38]|uniref:Ig-like domain-containing protein n=1 Tax=Erwinia sp. S38 TaxID=2769338 RepID=UPI0019091373